MRKLMRYTAAAAMIAAGPLMAQDTAPSVAEPRAEPSGANMSPEQMRTYGLWPDDRRAMFDSWPDEAKGYYWTLTPPRQEVFWMLSDGDRITLLGLSEADQEQTWQRLEQQMLASQPPVGAEPPPPPPEPPEPPTPAEKPEPPAPETPDNAAEDMTEVDDHGPR